MFLDSFISFRWFRLFSQVPPRPKILALGPPTFLIGFRCFGVDVIFVRWFSLFSLSFATPVPPENPWYWLSGWRALAEQAG